MSREIECWFVADREAGYASVFVPELDEEIQLGYSGDRKALEAEARREISERLCSPGSGGDYRGSGCMMPEICDFRSVLACGPEYAGHQRVVKEFDVS